MMEKLREFFNNRRVDEYDESDLITVDRRKPKPATVEQRLHNALDALNQTIVRHLDDLR